MGLLQDDLLKNLREIARIEAVRLLQVEEGLASILLNGPEGNPAQQLSQVIFTYVARDFLKGKYQDFNASFMNQAAMMNNLYLWLLSHPQELTMVSVVVNDNLFADRHWVAKGAILDYQKNDDVYRIGFVMVPALEIETKKAKLMALETASDEPEVFAQYILHENMRLPLDPLFFANAHEEEHGLLVESKYQVPPLPEVVTKLYLGNTQVSKALAELEPVKYGGPLPVGDKAVERLAVNMGGGRFEREGNPKMTIYERYMEAIKAIRERPVHDWNFLIAELAHPKIDFAGKDSEILEMIIAKEVAQDFQRKNALSIPIEFDARKLRLQAIMQGFEKNQGQYVMISYRLNQKIPLSVYFVGEITPGMVKPLKVPAFDPFDGLVWSIVINFGAEYQIEVENSGSQRHYYKEDVQVPVPQDLLGHVKEIGPGRLYVALIPAEYNRDGMPSQNFSIHIGDEEAIGLWVHDINPAYVPKKTLSHPTLKLAGEIAGDKLKIIK